jgi:5,10-methylenetetrahydromethanopterin reductase
VEEQAALEAADLLPAATFTGAPAQLRQKVNAFEAAGVTELVYQPAGSDIAGELARMIAAVG